jgi:hypothetical protein
MFSYDRGTVGVWVRGGCEVEARGTLRVGGVMERDLFSSFFPFLLDNGFERVRVRACGDEGVFDILYCKLY